MPAIRDEEWFYSTSFKEGALALEEGKKDVRFCGLMLGQDTLDGDEMDTILDAVRTTRTKSLCLDWFDVQTESFCKIGAMSTDEFQYQLDAFHLTMIDLSVPARLAAVSSLVEKNKHIVDLILTFCRINCSNVFLLADALKNNEQILSLNINFNLLRRDGYLTLAGALKENKTLRYVEAKLNKAEKQDLVDFVNELVKDNNNRTLEYLDLGQEDDIDGKIEKNKIPEEESVVKKKSSQKEKKPNTEQAADLEPLLAIPPVNGNNTDNIEQTDLFTLVKEYLENNKNGRIDRETELKVNQLEQIMESETPTIRASLKHCKIMMLGEKTSGKTFFTHCLVHQLYHANDDGNSPAIRKLDHLSLARVTELGWTKITAFHHVDMIIAKRISTLPINIENKNKANEVCFQFPEQVIISEKDLKADSVLAKEDKELLRRLEIEDDIDTNKAAVPVFTPAETEEISERFAGRMNDIIDKALRENNYPSFSIWDVDSPAGYNEIFSRFYNNHGLIFVFVNLAEVKTNAERAIKSVLKYLKPVDSAKGAGKDFTSKVFIIGTFLDEIINQGIDDGLSEWVEKFGHYKEAKGLSSSKNSGHLDFLLEKAPEDAADLRKLLESVKEMLQAFNVELTDAIASKYGDEIVPNDGDDLLFFPLSNNLPTACKQYRCDFDDISGINKFRAKVKSLLDSQQVKVINVMKSLRDAKIIDALITRKNTPKANEEDTKPYYMSLQEFVKLAATAGITSRAEVVILLRYLDVTGIVSWMSDTQTLQNLIVLTPDYIIQGLHKFYEVMSNGTESIEAIEKLNAEVADQGLSKDVDNLMNHRVVSHDLLLEKFLSRDNYEYFKDFLLNSYHLNRINLDVLKTVFGKQDLCNYSDSDELYLVPAFNQELAEITDIKSAFFPFKARFIPEAEISTGCYERVLTSLIDALDNDAMEQKLLQTENSLETSEHFATFTFGDNSFTIAQLKAQTGEDGASQFLQYEFCNESSLMFLDVIERVARNTLSIARVMVSVESEWIDLTEAREKNIKPYFVEKEPVAFSNDMLELEDAFDEL